VHPAPNPAMPKKPPISPAAISEIKPHDLTHRLWPPPVGYRCYRRKSHLSPEPNWAYAPGAAFSPGALIKRGLRVHLHVKLPILEYSSYLSDSIST